MILQKKHDIFNLFLPLPAFMNLPDSFFTDAFHFFQPGNITLNHIHGVSPEKSHNPFGKFGSYTFDQTGTQVFLNTKNCRRKRFFPALCHELTAIFTVHLPVAVNEQHRTYIDIQKISNDCYQIVIILHRAFKYCIAIFRVLISNSFHHATKFHG